MKRLAVLYADLAGYTAACLRRLKGDYETELLVYHWPIAPAAPFAPDTFSFIDHVIPRQGHSADEIARTVRNFAPDAVLMSGWMDKGYLRAARQLRQAGIPVVAGCDTQWRGTARQYAAALLAPRLLHSAIDVLWVSGERQRQFAEKLGYPGARVWDGLYACDWEAFTARDEVERARAFVYVGRYVDAKGLDVLLDAYQCYRASTDHPWELWCAGTGPLAALLEGMPGVENRGFMQPSSLPALLHKAGAFVLPSRWEPWGVVVQEAAAARLPLVCSDASGAGVHLVRTGFNGFSFGSGDATHLAEGLAHVAGLADEARRAYGERSFELSRQYTPARWAATLVEGARRLR